MYIYTLYQVAEFSTWVSASCRRSTKAETACNTVAEQKLLLFVDCSDAGKSSCPSFFQIAEQLERPMGSWLVLCIQCP